MNKANFDAFLSEVRAQREECRQDEPERIAEFIAANPAPKLANITLSGRKVELAPMFEVVAPAVRGFRNAPATVLKTLELVRAVQSKRKTLGRGQLKVV